jgi:hypothetical protein
MDMADGAASDAYERSSSMAKRTSTGDRERKSPTLSVVGGTPNPQRMSLGLDADVETHIGSRLRAMYDSVLREPMPARFLELLHQLDSKISEQTAKSHDRPASQKKSDRGS